MRQKAIRFDQTNPMGMFCGSRFNFPLRNIRSNIREISVYFDYVWSLCDGQHCSVGFLWEMWIEPSLLNTPMLLVWPENHFGVVYPGKMMKIWTISVYFYIFEVYTTGNTTYLGFCGGYGLSQVFLALLCYRLPENHFGDVNFEKMVKIWTISVHFDHLQSPCNGQHCSVGLLWEIWIESCPPNTLMLSVWPRNHFEVIYPEKMVRVRVILVHFDHFWSVRLNQSRGIFLFIET